MGEVGFSFPARLPFVLNKAYTAGYIAIMWDSLQLQESRMQVAGKISFYEERAGEAKIHHWVAQELGSILNAKKLLFMAVKTVPHGSRYGVPALRLGVVGSPWVQ